MLPSSPFKMDEKENRYFSCVMVTREEKLLYLWVLVASIFSVKVSYCIIMQAVSGNKE